MEPTPFRAARCAASVIRPIARRRVDEIAQALRSGSHFWWLDSALPSDRLGRFSFLGCDPYLVVRSRAGASELCCARAIHAGLEVGTRSVSGDTLEVVGSLLPKLSGTGSPIPFVGGAVGYLGYELAAEFEHHRFSGIDDLGLPDLYLLFVDSLIVHDALDGRSYACGLGLADDSEAARRAASLACESVSVRAVGPACGAPARSTAERRTERSPFAFFDAASYAKAVVEAKRQIEAGEVYQACLTHRTERDCVAPPFDLYRRLRCVNPAPFASYFELPEVAILSCSPERFVRLTRSGAVESRPIKGTRPRAATPAEDCANRAALESSAKDRAENLMIVDLVRNDLGRVCEIGSVEVPRLMEVESYASVHQLVSTVRGQLRPDRNALDLVRATFPPGSMTGAPKIAAMRALDRLEPVRRGVYSGAIGYLDARGGMDWSVVIRTILAQRGRAYVHSGGGIVADSDPWEEWLETTDKARLLWAALDEFPPA